jgi:hypothetical protein
VEAVPIPKENSDLLSYFLEKRVLNSFRACSLAGGEKAQKFHNSCLVSGTGGCPEHAVGEFQGGFPKAEKREALF